MGIMVLIPQETNSDLDTKQQLSDELNNHTSYNQTTTNNSSAPIALGDLRKSYNDMHSHKQTQLNNMLKMIPNTIEILLNANYEKELYNIYLDTRLLVKLRYEEYNNMDEKQFNSIDEIIIKIEKQIQYNINNLISLYKTDPLILTNTIKICEFEDDNNHNNNMKTLHHSCKDWAEW
eukprot:83822_1